MESIVEHVGSLPARPGTAPAQPGAVRGLIGRLLRLAFRRRAKVDDYPFADFAELAEATERELHALIGRPSYRDTRVRPTPYDLFRHF
jgi:hypothetical protein